MVLPDWMNRLLGSIMDHSAHHVDPGVPLYRLETAQERLESSLGDDIIVQQFSLRSLRTTLKVCKLYDYRHHRWTDFNASAGVSRAAGANDARAQGAPAHNNRRNSISPSPSGSCPG